MHNLMTVKETAEYLRIPLPTVYYLVQRGQLPAIQIGGRWRIKKTRSTATFCTPRSKGSLPCSWWMTNPTSSRCSSCC